MDKVNMKAKPKTHSEILWHFTGGPLWSEQKQQQLTKKKSLADAYSAFCSILKSKELRVGGYHEIIREKSKGHPLLFLRCWRQPTKFLS